MLEATQHIDHIVLPEMQKEEIANYKNIVHIDRWYLTSSYQLFIENSSQGNPCFRTGELYVIGLP